MQLKITNVKPKGDQHDEAVWLRATADCNLKDYMIADKTYDAKGESNLHRHLYWFPDKQVKKNDFIVLYTKKGTNESRKTTSGDPLHAFYWGLGVAVWNDDGDGAVLIRIAELEKRAVKATS